MSNSTHNNTAGERPAPRRLQPKRLPLHRQAYEGTAAAYVPTVTDSTTTSPPSFTPVDLAAACARKREVVTNLPRSCGHCGIGWEGADPKAIFEWEGSVIASCQAPGGCGRSDVLFVTPQFDEPRYRQVCVFEAQADHPSLSDTTYTIHGLMPWDVTCTKCRKTYADHHKGYDTNGWCVAVYKCVEPPADWPTFDPSSGTWKTFG